ncbi:hypothetical protein N7540_011831 [Penicillium herquei]|nr:hypothetical protein N7540_011831 [Penicillium herquei]
MKLLLPLSILATFALASPVVPRDPTQYVVLQFSNDLSGQPTAINVRIPVNNIERAILEGGPRRKTSSIQVVDQSHAPANFYCDVRVSGPVEFNHRLDGTETWESIGSSVLLASVNTELVPSTLVPEYSVRTPSLPHYVTALIYFLFAHRVGHQHLRSQAETDVVRFIFVFLLYEEPVHTGREPDDCILTLVGQIAGYERRVAAGMSTVRGWD